MSLSLLFVHSRERSSSSLVHDHIFTDEDVFVYRVIETTMKYWGIETTMRSESNLRNRSCMIKYNLRVLSCLNWKFDFVSHDIDEESDETSDEASDETDDEIDDETNDKTNDETNDETDFAWRVESNVSILFEKTKRIRIIVQRVEANKDFYSLERSIRDCCINRNSSWVFNSQVEQSFWDFELNQNNQTRSTNWSEWSDHVRAWALS